MADKIMILGTASGAGKSTVTAGIIRALRKRGYSVCPYKSQNMSLNSHVDINGGEMGRAQALQAQCADIEPMAWMNPILLKPSGDTTAQVIFNGEAVKTMSAVEYEAFKSELKRLLKADFQQRTAPYDFAVIEGAGSPAEINLRTNDIVNMGLAQLLDADAVLVGDIDRGGVFAALYGTCMLLPPEERQRIKGFILNKFRGDLALLQPGIVMMEELLHIPCLGVIPYRQLNLEEEDGAVEMNKRVQGEIDVAVIHLKHISNFTDLLPLEQEADVSVRYVDSPGELKNPDLLIIPGSKNTIYDLTDLKTRGLFDAIAGFAEKGGRILGICGGYQMLLEEILDPHGVEGDVPLAEGFGLLRGKTTFKPAKTLLRSKGNAVYQGKAQSVYGYEIHAGITETEEPPFILKENGGRDGAKSPDEKILGTYFHGIFDSMHWRGALLNAIRLERGLTAQAPKDFEGDKIKAMDALGSLMETNLDMEEIIRIAQRRP